MKNLKVVICLVLVLGISLTILYFQPIISKENHTYKEFTYSDQGVKKAVYSTYKTPEDFYQDRLERGERIHDSIYYHGQFEDGGWIFYSTDDFDEARAHVENEIMNSNVGNKEISETFENEKYFEFKTEETKWNGHTYILRHRVHKSSYIHLVGSTGVRVWGHTNETEQIEIGTFKQRPVDVPNSKELIEYLWFIGNYNLNGAKILDKTMSYNNQNVYYTFLETAFVGGDWGMHDVIYLAYSNYSINKTSGGIILMQKVIREIQGDYNPNSFYTPVECLFLPLVLISVVLICILLRRKRRIKTTKGNKDFQNYQNGEDDPQQNDQHLE